MTNERTPTIGQGLQDVAVFNSIFSRGTSFYRLSPRLSFQLGMEINSDKGTGERIVGSPQITNYALFVSSEIKVAQKIHIRPGIRFNKNTAYHAPPILPAMNTKITLAKTLDLRLAYARGFRSPALRELYFNFIDASHTILGNPNLRAEHSDSFTGSLHWRSLNTDKGTLNTVFSGFYNSYHQLITFGSDPSRPGVTTYVNIDQSKTAGATLDNSWQTKNMKAAIGMSCIGNYNKLSAESQTLGELPSLIWSTEVNTTLTYLMPKLGVNVAFFYKFSGNKPFYETVSDQGQTKVRLAQISEFHMADITLSRAITPHVTLNSGVKNLFNVTDLNNTSLQTSGVHGTGRNVSMGYGRSFFMGLAMQWKKK
jgi:outer membrane receptor for ferrienterochelin and colicins